MYTPHSHPRGEGGVSPSDSEALLPLFKQTLLVVSGGKKRTGRSVVAVFDTVTEFAVHLVRELQPSRPDVSERNISVKRPDR